MLDGIKWLDSTERPDSRATGEEEEGEEQDESREDMGIVFVDSTGRGQRVCLICLSTETFAAAV